MRKRFILLGIVAGVMLMLGFGLIWAMNAPAASDAGYVSLEEAPASGEAPKVLKLFSPYLSDSFPSHILHVFQNSVYSMTEHGVEIQIYEDKAVNSEWDNLEAVRSGMLEMCAVSAESLQRFTRQDGRDSKENPAGAQAADGAVLQLGRFWNGYQWLWTTAPIVEAEDLRTIDLRVSGAESEDGGIQDLVNSSVVIGNDELYLNLQAGFVNGYELDLTQVLQLGTYQFTRYCLELERSSSEVEIVMSQAAWEFLSDRERETIQACMDHALEYAREEYQQLLPLWKRVMETRYGVVFYQVSENLRREAGLI